MSNKPRMNSAYMSKLSQLKSPNNKIEDGDLERYGQPTLAGSQVSECFLSLNANQSLEIRAFGEMQGDRMICALR